jgi:hypothetical protein
MVAYSISERRSARGASSIDARQRQDCMLVLPMPGALVSCLLLAVPTCVALFCACQCPEVYHPIRCVLWWSYVGLVVPRSSHLLLSLDKMAVLCVQQCLTLTWRRAQHNGCHACVYAAPVQ